MKSLGVVILLGICVPGLLAGHGDHVSMFCYSCDHVTDPTLCTTLMTCGRGKHCGAEVETKEGRMNFRLGCIDGHICDGAPTEPPHIIGRREHHHLPDHLHCAQCCTTDKCNRQLCGTYATNHTNVIQPGTASHVSGTCMDHQEDGFACGLFDRKVVCEASDPTSSAYYLAHTKCPKFCGFCGGDGAAVLGGTTLSSNTDATVTALVATDAGPAVTPNTDSAATGVQVVVDPSLPCVDDHANGFSCDAFDLFNFCSDNTSFAYPVAQEKCRRHCGFCTDLPTVTDSDKPIV